MAAPVKPKELSLPNWVPGFFPWILLFLFSIGVAEGENLVANPGFEEFDVDRPLRWNLFVQPGPGATGKYVSESHDGEFAILLHTPTPYAREPVNNWSQNIVAELAASTVNVSGWIKTAAAKEAALWVQCWQRSPRRVIATYTTSTDTPMYGNRDWEECSMEVAVPKGTDFLVLRCVLLGTGTAWFDDVSVSPVEAAAPDPVPERPEAPMVMESLQGPPVTSDPTASLVANIEGEIGRLREANLILADALQKVREDNAGLMGELLQLRVELEEVRRERQGEDAAPRRVPPLVPHGMDWRLVE